MPAVREGPAVAVASTVTAWLTQRVGCGSVGVAKETLTGSLSTRTVFWAVYSTPAAFVAVRSTGKDPSVATCDRVSTPNDQLTGVGHCCQTVLSRGSGGPFDCTLPALAEELQMPETSLA